MRSGEDVPGVQMTDKISLTIPAGRRFRSVATLVVGGVGSRFDVPYERMDDLQLALLSLLDAVEEDEATVNLEPEPAGLTVTVGPLKPGSAEDAGLARVLTPLVDELAADARDGAEWMTVRIAARPQVAQEPQAS